MDGSKIRTFVPKSGAPGCPVPAGSEAAPQKPMLPLPTTNRATSGRNDIVLIIKKSGMIWLAPVRCGRLEFARKLSKKNPLCAHEAPPDFCAVPSGVLPGRAGSPLPAARDAPQSKTALSEKANNSPSPGGKSIILDPAFPPENTPRHEDNTLANPSPPFQFDDFVDDRARRIGWRRLDHE